MTAPSSTIEVAVDLTGLDATSSVSATAVSNSTVVSTAVLTGPTGATGATGPTGATGSQGEPGQGVAAGGTIGQVLTKASSTSYDTFWDDAASGGSGSTSSFAVTQTAHGFVVGDVLRSAGTANTYAKAKADSAAHAEIVGIVTVVTDANTFSVTTQGIVTTGVPAATAGTVMFLSASTAGALSSTEPSSLGDVSKPLAIVLESSVRMLFSNFRGELINSSSGGGGGAGTISVEEVDGAPAVTDVSTIVVTNGTLTDDGGGQVTINTGGSGDASGPASSTDNAIARFDSTTGKLLQNSTPTITDGGIISNVTDPSNAQDAATKAYVDSSNNPPATCTIGVTGTTADYTCDGTDDDVQVQTALNALPSTGGSIYLQEGTYNFSTTVYRNISNVRIFGAGYATKIKWQDSTNPSNIGLIKTSNFWSITDLQIDGNKANNSGGYAIHLYQSSRVIMDRLYIANCKQAAIFTEGTSLLMSHANKYSNLYFRDCDSYAVHIKDISPDNQFMNVWVGLCNIGIRIEGAANFLTNVHIWGCTGNGLEIAANDCRVTNGYYETNGAAGIAITGTFGTPKHDAKIIGAHLLLNGANGITASYINKSTITSCTFKDNTGIGATFADCADIEILGNVFGNDVNPKVQTYGVTSTATTDRLALGFNNIRATNHLTGNYSLVGSSNEIGHNHE
jgi:hypothetical protein